MLFESPTSHPVQFFNRGLTTSKQHTEHRSLYIRPTTTSQGPHPSLVHHGRSWAVVGTLGRSQCFLTLPVTQANWHPSLYNNLVREAGTIYHPLNPFLGEITYQTWDVQKRLDACQIMFDNRFTTMKRKRGISSIVWESLKSQPQTNSSQSCLNR